MNRWWSRTRPSKAFSSSTTLLPQPALRQVGQLLGVGSALAKIASSISRAETPVTLLATPASLMFAHSRTFCN